MNGWDSLELQNENHRTQVFTHSFISYLSSPVYRAYIKVSTPTVLCRESLSFAEPCQISRTSRFPYSTSTLMGIANIAIIDEARHILQASEMQMRCGVSLETAT